jgi:hypothetical protein
MKTSNFEAVKIALKQDKTGFILTLNIHPDELSEEILRDFVGARYQVVMVRIGDDEKPIQRENFANDIVQSAGILCRDKNFARFLMETGQIFDDSEEAVTDCLKEELGIQSRTELKTNKEAASKFLHINQEYASWKLNV